MIINATLSFIKEILLVIIFNIFFFFNNRSKNTISDIKLEKGDEVNLLDAASQGASQAIMLVLNIAASLIAFLAFVGFLNGIIR